MNEVERSERLCPKCNQPPDQVGRGDGCNDPYCPINDEPRCISQRFVPNRETPFASDWIEQTWTNGRKTVRVALPPKHNEKDPNDIIFDYDAGRRMAERMLTPNATRPNQPNP